MELHELGTLTMTYRTITMLDYGAGGQIYGTLAGEVSGERLSGELELTNLAARRPDDVNLPAVRGLLRTGDGATVWMEGDGISVLRPEDGVRAFIATMRFRTGDERYAWVNTVTCLLEAVLDTVGVGGRVHGVLHECRHTLT